VKVIELRAPGVSTVDAEFLQPQILGGVIFKDFSPQERMIIWDNIRVFKGIIPSLFTFFQDIILLEACIDGVKRLVTVAPNQTVFTALDGLFESNIESQWIQTSETTFASERGSRTACKTLGILGLLAFAMRMYVSLPKDPVKQNRKAKPRAKADQGVLQRLGALASHLGCKSPKIEELMKLPVPPIIQDAQEFVPLLVTTGPGVNIEDRLGFPHEDNFKDDMKYLFLHNLCEDRVETGEGITSFFVLKSWFTAFFKPPQWSRPIVTAESPNPPSVPQVSDERVEEDVDMEQPRPQSPVNQELEQQQEVAQVRQSIQFSEPVQETGLSGHAVEVNQRFEMEQEVETSLGQLPGTCPF
jgi:hypothetical protein